MRNIIEACCWMSTSVHNKNKQLDNGSPKSRWCWCWLWRSILNKIKTGRVKIKAKSQLCLFNSLLSQQYTWKCHTRHCIVYKRIYPDDVKEGDTNLWNLWQWKHLLGADLKSRTLMENPVSDRIVQEITKYHSIDWKFNPPSASHAGCDSRLWWEAQGPSKQSLEMLMKKSVTQPSVAHVSSDSHDLLPLTPSHFLVREMRGSFTAETLHEEVYNPKNLWNCMQHLLR